MMMNDEIKKIKECALCCRKWDNSTIMIQYGKKYICDLCYQEQVYINNMLGANTSNCDHENDCDEKYDEYEELFDKVRPRSHIMEFRAFTELKKECPTPREIVAYLNKSIVGQEEAKRALAVAIHNHHRRINSEGEGIKIPKSNILLQGPTGCGKTFILKKLADLLDVPFYIADASTITEAGYKGNDIESVVTGLYQAASGDIAKTEKGIIYLDEFDKLSAKFGHGSEESTVGAGVQRQMLKMIEGCVMDVPKTGYKKTGECVTINTENILFICGGAFAGIRKDKTTKTRNMIGFNTGENCEGIEGELNDKLCPQDFIDYGFIPEIIGRLPIIASLRELEENDLVDVLMNTDNSLVKTYCAFFAEAYNVELVFHDSAIKEIAHQAYIRKTGARGINAIVENVMQEILFEIPSDSSIRKCTITKEAVLGSSKPYLLRENDVSKQYVS